MGWVILFGLGIASLALAWALGVARALWTFVAAALMLGAAGYALQGRPGLPGAPAETQTRTAEFDPELTELRRAMIGRFVSSDPFFAAADALMRSGAERAAVRVMLGGINKNPGDFSVWMGLGTAYAAHDHMVSPPSEFAFRHAMQLAPKHPAPPFFFGLAYARAGEFARARPYWARALELTQEEASYRDDIAVRLMLLDRFLAMQEEATSP